MLFYILILERVNFRLNIFKLGIIEKTCMLQKVFFIMAEETDTKSCEKKKQLRYWEETHQVDVIAIAASVISLAIPFIGLLAYNGNNFQVRDITENNWVSESFFS